MKKSKTINLAASFILICLIACQKDSDKTPQLIPNFGFENWASDVEEPLGWDNNNCSLCSPPWDSVPIKKDSIEVYAGKYSAKFIYNYAYRAWAQAIIRTPLHPKALTAYVKSKICSPDSVLIKVSLFKKGMIADEGVWYGNSTIEKYTKVVIPISQNVTSVDSIIIDIKGGENQISTVECRKTKFWIDELAFAF